MNDNFGNELHEHDLVYFVELNRPKSTFKSGAKIYKGIILSMTKCYATIAVKEGDITIYITTKKSSKIGLVKKASDTNY